MENKDITLEEYISLHYHPHLLKKNACAPKKIKPKEYEPNLFCSIISGDKLPAPESKPKSSDIILKDKTFVQLLFEFIDNGHYSDVEIYTKAGIDRKHFSKMRSDYQYHPNKDTAIKFAIALQLSLPLAKRLLKTAGYTFSSSILRDVVLEYCFEKEIYDFPKINEILEQQNCDYIG